MTPPESPDRQNSTSPDLSREGDHSIARGLARPAAARYQEDPDSPVPVNPLEQHQMQQQMVTAIAQQQELMNKLLEDRTPDQASSTHLDRTNALVGIKFETHVPILKDSDPDFDEHWNNFQNLIDCHAWGRKGVRPWDVLTIYRKALPANSTRLKIYDNHMRQARREDRIPHDAATVLEEIKERLRSCIKKDYI